MPLMPKRVKYRKSQRGSMRGLTLAGSQLNFGEFGLQALQNAWLTNAQLEAARVALTRNIKRGGKVWIRIFPDKPISKKPAETRMGKGKGSTEHWAAVIKRGKIIFEMEGVPEEIARESMRLAAHKLSFKTKFVSRRIYK